MEFRQLFILLRRWAWLLVLGLILGAAAGYFFSSRQTPIYRASTKIMVILASQQATYDYVSPYVAQDLASTFVQMLSTQPILDAVSKRVDYRVTSSAIKTQTSSNGKIIQIFVEDSDPSRAALIANTLVEVLVQQNEALESSRYIRQEESLQSQINQVESQAADLQTQIDQASTVNLQEQVKQTGDQISSLQSEISTLEADIIQLSQGPAAISVENQTLIIEKQARLAQIQPLLAKYQEVYTNLVVLGQTSYTGDGNKLTQMQKTLDLYQQMHIQLLGNLENVRLARLQSTSTAQQIEPATAPEFSIRPRNVYNSLLAGLAGLIIMGVVAFLIESLDDTIKASSDVKKLLDVPVLGYIAQIPTRQNDTPRPYVARQPRSPISEAFRKLRTQLELATDNAHLQTIMVTSTGAGEGKSTVAVNLATIIAHRGKKVLLVDADLRKPSVHKFLGSSNRSGLSDILGKDTDPQSVLQQVDGVEGLSVITSGSMPFNPTELLDSEKMETFLQGFKNIVDVIIIDTAPFIVADAQVISVKVDGVLIVIKPGQAHAGGALMMLEQLRESGAKILGVVLNNIGRNLSGDYGGHYYNYSSTRDYRNYTDDVTPDHKATSNNTSEPLVSHSVKRKRVLKVSKDS